MQINLNFLQSTGVKTFGKGSTSKPHTNRMNAKMVDPETGLAGEGLLADLAVKWLFFLKTERKWGLFRTKQAQPLDV